jgi:hypothetical protein
VTLPLDRLNASLSRHWERLGAVPSTWTPNDGTVQPCSGLWGPVDPIAYAEGFRSDRRTVSIPAAQITGTPRRGDVVTGEPSDPTAGWEVERAGLDGGLWSLTVVSAPKASPRTRGGR